MDNIQTNQELPLHGLCNDTSPGLQPNGSTPFLLGANLDDAEGNQGAVVNENANKLCVEFPEGFHIRGIISCGPHNQAVLGYTKIGDVITSYIFYVDLQNCTYSTKLQSSCANLIYNLTGEYRVIKGCEGIIYFRDGVNPDRFLNLDKVTELNPDCNDLRLNPDVNVVNIELESVNDTGGQLKIGNYAIQVEYLTSNQEPIYRSYISPTVPIVDDAQNTSYDSLDGALNIDTNLADIGGVPPTNKSITFRLSNLDTRFPYYKINVVAYINSDGLTPTTYRIGTLFPINSTESIFTFTGYNPANGDTQIDYAGINIPLVKYESSRALEQVQNRMVRVNVKENSRDYSKYQKIVNDITSSPVIGSVTANDQFSLGDSKNPKTYFESTGYQSDEIYPFGIVFIFKNGEESPVFHIPGRESTSFDIEKLVIGTDVPLEETRHLGLSIGDEIERWKVFNTGNATQMAYHESDSGLYPEIKDCNGEFIFGDLANTPVRHHRFPSRKEVPMVEGDNLNIFGIQFDNIQYPDTDIVGHYIVRGKRDEINRTVLDSGYLSHLIEDTAGVKYFGIQSFPFTDTPVYFNLFSPKILSLQSYLNATHFTFHNVYGLNENFEFDSYEGWDSQMKFYDVTSANSVSITNRTVDGNLIIKPRAVQASVPSFNNLDLRNQTINGVGNFIHLQDTPGNFGFAENEHKLFYVTVKRVQDVFSNVLNINYYRTHSGFFTSNSSIVYGGDTFVSKLNLELINAYGQTDEFVNGHYLPNLWVESEINLGFRLQGTVGCSKYFQYLEDDTIKESFNKYLVTKVTDANFDGVPVESICPAYYKINPDLSRLQYDTNYQSLWLGYDYCSKCLSQYKNRLLYSEKSFQDDLGDNYRTYLANNYVDLSSDRGPITSLNYRNNKLIVRYTDGLTILYPNPQMLQTDQNSVYIGAGDFLSLPDSEIMRSDSGYAGQQSVYAECMTPYGVVWADETRGKIFMFDDNLEEISRYKMYHWFEKNMKSFIKEDLKYYGLEYNPDEFGIRMTYDPKFERLIVHKKDFKFTKKFKDELIGDITIEPNGIRHNDTLYLFSNKEYFINKSWTISYSIRTKVWISWHSYQPDYMSYGANTFYTSFNNQLWSHDEYHRFNEFYGTKFPFIVEFVNKQLNTFNLHAVHYWAYGQDYDSDTDQWNENDLTFNKAIFYTNDQSSGIVSLEVPANEFESTQFFTDKKWAIRTDKNWKVASIRDISNGSPVTTSNWNELQDYFTDVNGYIDKVPTNVNVNVDQYLQNEFRDKWMLARLIYDVGVTTKLTINVMLFKNYDSIR